MNQGLSELKNVPQWGKPRTNENNILGMVYTVCILYIWNAYPSNSNLDTFRRTLYNICKLAVEKRGRPESIHHVSARVLEVVGKGRYSILNLKASFLPVKTSSFHHAKVWSPKMWYIAQWMVLCASWAPPPYIHLASN